jgi:uncharacterized lipoprotein YajG
MKRLLTPFALLALLSVFMTGCTSNSKIIATGLSIELTSLAPQADGTVKVGWHVANANIVSYLLSRVNHRISVNGVALGTINDLEPLAVPASTNAPRTSVLKPTAEAAKLLQSTGSVRYEVDTKITILIYGETTEDSKLSNRGSVAVTR